MESDVLQDLSYHGAPRISVEPPGPKSRALLERQRVKEGNTVSYPRGIPVAFESGRGATVKDADGNIYIDFFGGAGALVVGHSNPKVVEAVRDQVGRLTHSLDFPNSIRSRITDTIVSQAPGSLKNDCKIVFGGPTGSDAVEAAIKLAKINTGRSGILAFSGGYHGMTSGALAATSDRFHKEMYLPLLPEVHFSPYAYCYRCPFGLEYPGCGVQCADYLESLLGNPHSGVSNPAAVIVEPVQGEGGSIVPPPEFLPRVEEITEGHSVPLILDEIQAGIGRTGKMWSCELFECEPDIMTISKGLGGGLPLSAIAYRPGLDTWKPGAHIGTFRGNLTGMAAGLAALNFIEEHSLLEHATDLGKHILERLTEESNGSRFIGDVRGVGLIIGIEFVKDKVSKKPFPDMAREIRREAFKRGLITELGGHYRNVVRFLPPLVLFEELADVGIDIFFDTVKYLETRYLQR